MLKAPPRRGVRRREPGGSGRSSLAALLAAGLRRRRRRRARGLPRDRRRTRSSSTSTTTTAIRWRSSPGRDGTPRAARSASAARPLASRAPFPTGAPRDAALRASPERDAFARTLAGGARDAGRGGRADPRRASPRTVRYDPDRSRRQDPASVFASRRAHCVGFAELAVDLLRRVGHPRAHRPGHPARRSRAADGYDAAHRRRLSPLDRGLLPGPRVRLLGSVRLDQRRRRALRPVRAAGARAAAGLTVTAVEASGRARLPGPAPARRHAAASRPIGAARVAARLPVRDGRAALSVIFARSAWRRSTHPREIEGEVAAALGRGARRRRRHGRPGRRVLHAEHVSVPVGQPAARRPRAQLHPRRRALPPRAHGRPQGPEPDGLGRLRPAGRERRDPERRPPARVHARRTSRG